MVYFKRTRIKDALEQKGMTIIQLADVIGRGRETVSGWVKGTSNPNAADIASLCNALEISVDFLFPVVR